MRAPRTLVSLLSGRDEDLNLARRRVPHDRLVLIVQAGVERQAEAVRARDERLGMADRLDVVRIEADDVREQAAAIGRALDRYRQGDVVLNAAGGDTGLMAAALYTAYERGVETWFFQEGRADRLPILHDLRLRDRVDAMEGRVLVALPKDGATSRWLAETQLIARDKIERALRTLRKKGLVRLSAQDGLTHAALTESGAYVREHLGAAGKKPQLRA